MFILFLSTGYFYLFKKDYSFKYYETLENLANDELNKLISIHEDCFKATKISNLEKYFTEIRDHKREIATQLVKHQIDKQDKNKTSRFKRMTNYHILYENNDMIGFYSCEEEEESNLKAPRETRGNVIIYDVCLTSSKRGKQIGNKLMGDAMKECYVKGKKIMLTVYQYHKKVVDWYKRLNFNIISDLSEWSEDFNYFNKYLMEHREDKNE